MISSDIKNKIITYLIPFAPRKIGVFGSYARNESTVNSDLDILIDLKQNLNLLDLIGLEMELSEILGIKVDLITERSVNNLLRPYIEKDLEILFSNEE